MLLANSDAALNLLPKAIAEAQDAVRIDPKRSASYSFLAELQERNKDISSAEENYRKAVSVDPKSVSALLILGRFYARRNRPADAREGISIRYCDKSSRPYSACHARRALPKPGPKGSSPAGIAGHQG